MVWINMLKEDNQETAEKAITQFQADERVVHFHDPNQLAGKAIAESLGAGNAVAWDIYLFYDAEILWGNVSPKPIEWFHQLDDAWIDPAHFAWNEALKTWLDETFQKLERKT